MFNLIKPKTHMMKKIFLLAAVAVMSFVSVNNANAQNNNDREGRRAEMQARQMERLERDLKLTDEQKAKFEPIYQNYMKELFGVRQQPNREQADQESKKELTDAEATAQLQQVFERQAEQIQQSQLRLDIQKKYCAELSNVLTPQQLLKVFQPQQGRNRGGQQGGRGGRGFNGGPRGGGFGGNGGFGGPGGDF